MKDKLLYKAFIAANLALGLVWLRSSIEKFTAGKFVETLSPTLTKFASDNPFLWYKHFLFSTAIPNSLLLGSLILWGELLTGVVLTVSCFFLLWKPYHKIAFLALLGGLIGGICLNLNFYFAAGWMNPSTETLNLLMFVLEVLGLIVIERLILVNSNK